MGGEEEIKKFFAKEDWRREREDFDVGSGREALREALSRIINSILDKYLSESDETIIDLGAGEGWLAKTINKIWREGGRYIPFDINPNFLSRIKEQGLCQETIEGSVYERKRQTSNSGC